MELDAWLDERRRRVDEALADLLPPAGAHPPRIHEAIRHALLGPGKRLRPILVIAGAELVGGRPEDVREAAVALEAIHASTLVLDDLPAMDDAALRRGRPATHRAYGEATAILAAVALLVHAFDLLARNGDRLRVRRDRLARVVSEAALATGTSGLVAGQHEDLAAVGRTLDVRALEYIHRHKTGRLFELAATIGPLLLAAPEADVEALRSYAKNLGLAYQITDDLLDRHGDPRVTGKETGRDAARTTFASLVEPGEAEALVAELLETARGWVRPFGRRARRLDELARSLERRQA